MKSAGCFALISAAAIVNAEPLPVHDLNPLLTGYELPPALSSRVSGPALSAQFAIGNISLEQRAGLDSLHLDAELQRWQLSFAKPFGEHFTLRIDLPYLNLSGGHLDSFIESWHRSFGLPNGNRAQLPRNRLLIQHDVAGKVDYQLQNASQGIGDLTLRVGRQLGDHDGYANLLWLSVKLPTGAADRLLGSGATDMAASLSSSQSLTPRLSSYQQLSIALLGKGARLVAQQQSIVWSGTLGVDAHISSRWSAAVQLDGHSNVFDSRLRGLGDALQLNFGPRYQSRNWQANFFISEDIAVDTAPDVQFQLDIQRSW